MMTIRIDEEYSSEEWWNEARNSTRVAAILIAPLLDGRQSEINLTTTEGKMVWKWASKMPGWESGLEYAPHPLVFNG